MTPERVTLAVSLALVAAATVGWFYLRPGTRVSAWLDREINAATTLPRPAATHTRLETFL